jgi:copper homeostasis protein
MLLEICANSYQSAKNAQEAGADRIELCQELSVGGITPSYGLLKQVVENLDISVFVLIRPRGGDFVFSDIEYKIMKSNIQLCKDFGCQGIVSGVLNADKTIDFGRTKELVQLSRPLKFTFHRAFDEVSNPKQAIEQLIDLGIERILTSGQETSAEKGLDLLKSLNAISKGRITILAGSGVNSENAIKFKEAGLSELHASASSKIETHDSIFSMPVTVSGSNKIEAIKSVIKNE